MSIQIVPMDSTDSTNGTNNPLNEYDAWRAYWNTHGQAWRTEPEIAAQRQEELSARLAIASDIWNGRYPFSDYSLNRADIEWLLAELQATPQYQHEQHSQHVILDVRGANLSKVDLRGLPLHALCGGLSEEEWRNATPEQRDIAAVHMERADMRGTYLQGAMLHGAHLEGADLRDAHLEGADLRDAHLEGKGHSLKPLPAADMRMAFFDKNTRLDNIILGNEANGVVKVADVHWGDVSLAPVDWSRVDRLGDELDARQWKDLDSYRAAVRANRQLARALYTQGLREDAHHFAYRAHVNRRVILRRQWIFPLFLRLLQYPQMPSPLALRRIEQWWQSKQPQHSILPSILFRIMLLLVLLIAFAVWQPLAFAAVLCLLVVPLVLFYLLLRRRARLAYTYQPAQPLVLPRNLTTAKQRQQQKFLLLLHFLLGKPVATVTQPLQSQWKFPSLLLFLALLDNTLVSGVKYLFSLLLDALSGYGYKWGRTLCWYALLILGFGVSFALVAHVSPLASLLMSIASFHGRGFFATNNFSWSSPVVALEIGESIIGLVFGLCLLITVVFYRLRD
ncbi:MAG TPA: hypothetical protein DHW02_19980 [Ktedonobacter sp.]|nr:hypothetical protein [Ktedonobacter sp.]